MSNYLTPSPGDLSVKLLNTVLGPNWQDLFIKGAQGAHLTLIGHLFSVFNVIVLSGLVALFGAVTVSGIISTAHSGQVGGKGIHSAWMPIRAVGSIGMLSPLPWAKGLCLLQTLTLMFISYGIGLADHLWTPAVQYMAEQGGTIEGPRPVAAWSASETILRTLIARDYFVQRGIAGTSPAAPVFAFVPGSGGNSTAKYVLVFPAPRGANFQNFGTITVPCAGAQSDPLCAAKRNAIAGVAIGLEPVAEDIVSHYKGGKNTPLPPASDITGLLSSYTATVQSAVPGYIATAQASLARQQQAFAQQAANEGWASAGDWYEALAAENDLVHRAVSKVPTATAAKWSQIRGDIPDQTRLRAYLANGEVLMREADPGLARQYDEKLSRGVTRGGRAARQDFVERWFSNEVTGRAVGLVENAIGNPSGDPLARLQAVGNRMDDAVGGFWAAVATARLIPGWNVKLPTNLHYAALGLLAAGADLAVYLPALPFILWMLALGGWLVLVLESLVAAPLWAAAHGMPEGEGFAGESGRQGYLLLLNVLLRPALMIFGFFIASAVFDGLAWAVGQGWKIYSTAEGVGYVLGPVDAAATVMVLVVLLTLLAHQAFGLITWLPANVTAWIGSRGQELGGGADQVRAQVKSAGAGVATATKNIYTPSSPGGAGKTPAQSPGAKE